jgi:hypothetical protein
MIDENTFGKGRRKWRGFKEAVDPDTGELMIISRFEQNVEADVDWESIWKKNLLHALRIFKNPGISVFEYFLENRNYENKVFSNKEMVVRGTGVSRATVYRIIDKLLNADVIKKLELGYQVNPNIIFNSLEAKKKNITRLDVVLSYKGFKTKKKETFIFEELKSRYEK